MVDAVSTRPDAGHDADHGSAADARAIPLNGQHEEGVVSEAQVPPADTLPTQMPGDVIEPGRALALADFAPPSVAQRKTSRCVTAAAP